VFVFVWPNPSDYTAPDKQTVILAPCLQFCHQLISSAEFALFAVPSDSEVIQRESKQERKYVRENLKEGNNRGLF
jgi:hypothetical protein